MNKWTSLNILGRPELASRRQLQTLLPMRFTAIKAFFLSQRKRLR